MESRTGRRTLMGKERNRQSRELNKKNEQCRRIKMKLWEYRTKKGREKSRDWSMK